MSNRKKLFTIGMFSAVSLLVLAISSGLVFAKQSQSGETEPQVQGTNISSNQVAQGSEESQDSPGVNSGVVTDTSRNNPVTQQSDSPATTSASPANSSINNENGHETSNPPNDQLIDYEVIETGTLAGSVTTIANIPGNPIGSVSKPFQAKILVKNLSGTTVAEIMPDTDGNFSVNLETGSYKVEPQDAGSFYFTPGLLYVDIHANQTTALSFSYSPIATTN